MIVNYTEKKVPLYNIRACRRHNTYNIALNMGITILNVGSQCGFRNKTMFLLQHPFPLVLPQKEN